MRILILCEKLDIDYTSSGIGRSKLINALSSLSHSVDVLFDQFHQSDVSKVADVRFMRLEKQPNLFSKLSAFSKLGAVLNYLIGQNFDTLKQIYWWKKHTQKLLKKNDYNLIYVLGSGQQWYTFFAMKLVKTNVPFVLNFHDPYPSSYHPEFKRSIHWVERLRYLSIKSVTKRAYKVTLPSQLLATYLEQFYPIKNKWVIIPHAGLHLPFLQLFKTEESKKMVVSHTGLLLSSRNPKNLILAFLDLFDKYPTARQEVLLKIVGPFKIKDSNLESLLLANVDWIVLEKERISYAESMQILYNSDVQVLIDFDSDFSPIMLGKLGDYFSFNKPIIALTPDNSETSRLLGSDYFFKAALNNGNKQKEIVEKLYVLWKSKNLESIDLSAQQQYVSANNIQSLFENKIIQPLAKK